jgi:hypothetical protein
VGRFAESDPVLDAMLAAIADRADDFDLEIIEDLAEAVGPNGLWEAIIGPALDQLSARIGVPLTRKEIDPAVTEAKNERAKLAGENALPLPVLPNQEGPTVMLGHDPGQEPGTVAMIQGTCPHCQSTFLTTLESVVKEETDTCPHCGKDFMQSGTLKPAGPEGGSSP